MRDAKLSDSPEERLFRCSADFIRSTGTLQAAMSWLTAEADGSWDYSWVISAFYFAREEDMIKFKLKWDNGIS